MDVRLAPRTLAAIVGFGGVAVVTAVFLAVGDIPTSIPALILMLPIIGAAVLADWRIALPVALVAGVSYSLAFLPPTGVITVGFSQDVYMAVTFCGVAVLVSLLVSRRSRLRRELLLDAERMELLRAVAHDLRSPLHTIRSVSDDLLESDLYDDATRSRLLTVVRDESERLEHIAGNLLSLSRLRAGAFVPARQAESIGELIAGCVDRLARLERGRVTAVLDDDLPDVLVDRVQIDQVLVNLVDNARRYSPPDAPVEISASGDGLVVAVAIDDHGSGFSPAQLQAPFEAFRSGHGSAGLGLTVCKAIIEANGGTIALGANSYGGARVTIRLPAAR